MSEFTKNQSQRGHIEHLWSLLDDISTLGDALKPDLSDPFVRRVLDLAERRMEHGVCSPDGQTLYVPESS